MRAVLRRLGGSRGAVPLVLCAGALWLFRGALFRGELFYERDLFAYYEPAKALLVRLVRETRGLPLWNPYLGGGQPFAANPEHELYHPLTWLLLVFDLSAALRLQILLPVLGAGLGMARLLRALQRSRAAALFGAVAWAFGGYVLSATNLLPILLAVAALPFVLAEVALLARQARPTAAVVRLALATGLLVNAGEPSTLLVTAVLAPIVYTWARPTSRAWLGRGAAAASLGLLLGSGIGAAVLVPGLHLASKGERAGGLPDWIANDWSLPWIRLAELATPQACGFQLLGRSFYWVQDLYPTRGRPFFYGLYPGLLVTLLGAAGFLALRGRRRTLAPIVLAGLGGLALSAGVHAPLWPLVRRLPLLSGLRYPEKFVLIPVLLLALLAPLGFDLLLRRRVRAPAIGAATLLTCSAVALAAVAILPEPGASTSTFLAQRLDATAARILPPLVWNEAAFAVLLAAGTLLALRLLGTAGPRLGAPALTAVLLVDLLRAGRPLVPTSRRSLAPTPAAEQLLSVGRGGYVFNHAATIRQFEHEPGILRPPRTALWGIATLFDSDFDLTNLVWSNADRREFLELYEGFPALREPLLRRRSVRAVVELLPGVKIEGTKLVPPGKAIEVVRVLRVRNPQPKEFFAGSVAFVGEGNERARALLAAGDGAAELVCLDPRDQSELPAPPGRGSSRVLQRRPGRLDLEVTVEGSGAGLLALNQTWDEFWRASIDGRPVRLLRADVGASAVVVPPGSHRVSLRYDDPYVRGGLLLTILSLGATALLALATRRRGPG